MCINPLAGVTLNSTAFKALLKYFYTGQYDVVSLDSTDCTGLLALVDYFGLQETPDLQRIHTKFIVSLQLKCDQDEVSEEEAPNSLQSVT